jgi:hypothetical protein
MKPKTLITVTVLVVLLPLLSSTLAQAQLLFRVDVPFEFVAGGIHLSSGKYLAFHATPAVIKLVREDGRASAWIFVKASPVATGDGPSHMVFNRYGDTYFLSQVRTQHDRQVHESYKCLSEQTLAAQYRGSEPKAITIAAK